MKYAIVLAVALGLLTIGTMNSFAQTTTSTSGDPIFMNYDNLNIPGDVTAAGHEKWIEINSFQFGVTRTISNTAGSADRQASAPSVSEIVITKLMDKSSPLLFKEALSGNGKPVTIDFVTSGGGPSGPTVYAQYKLENVLISGYSTSSGGDRPTESISLSFTKITYTFNSQDPNTGQLTPTSVTYDLSLAKVS